MFGVVVFPGSNCDHDCYHVIKHVIGQEARFIWHKEERLPGELRVVVLPGGFSYGDYLRTGAIARFSPVMKAVEGFAKEGGLVMGICNGFQILLEAGLLPGAMLRNRGLKFVCKDVFLRVENPETPFTNALEKGSVIRVPIAHAEGNYFIDPGGLDSLVKNRQVVFRYCGREGNITDEANPNGSLSNIAGIINKEGNVLGMMPHPERCAEASLGNEDGRRVFESILSYLEGSHLKGASALR
jgi:phosphoribosylformylglycinamidine synthase